MSAPQSRWDRYDARHAYDELLDEHGEPRDGARGLVAYLQAMSGAELRERREAAERTIQVMGITFTVYSDGANIDRSWPFDIIPRVIAGRTWRRCEAGLRQRLTALNHFISDVYGRQLIFRDRVMPRELLEDSVNYRPQCVGMKPRYGAWAHVCGSDLVRGADGAFYVLEDNLRVPSGVSYMLENRKLTKQIFPELFENLKIKPIGEYTGRLFDTLAALSPRRSRRPLVVVLTPGIYNSAYFEHCFLAQQMGAQLVEGADLVVDSDDCLYMKTIQGLQRVDVVYRRIDDLFLDPECKGFNPDSALGVPGIMRAWSRGKVALANAPGAGVADDKVIYAFVPAMIRYYLDEDPILPNVETYLCADPLQRKHVLANLDRLVVKPANESGGYGLLIGPRASAAERKRFAALIRKDPRNYIAQPLVSLSTVPTFCRGRAEPRHVDLRPFALQSAETYVTAGGLTRVAMEKGSYVVNSSQGGGSKDTWVVTGKGE